MKVLFYVAASPEIGIGHLMRCHALALHARKRGLTVGFYLTREGKQIAQRIPGFSWPMLKAEDALTDSNLPAASALVLDGYEFSVALRSQLQQRASKVLWIDELERAAPLFVDAVLDSTGTASTHSHPNIEHYFLGPEFQPLRPEFVNAKPTERTDIISFIFGGSDPKDGLRFCAEQLLDSSWQQQPLQFIAGPAYAQLNALENIVAQAPAWKIMVNPNNIAEELHRSRLVVTACGSTTFECWALETPMWAIQVADNQSAQAAYLQQHQLANVSNWPSFMTCDLASELEILTNPSQLKHLHDAQTRLRCGHRLAEVIDWLSA